MFCSFPGRQLLFASLLGLVATHTAFATNVVIQHPFNSYTSTPPSLSAIGFAGISTNAGGGAYVSQTQLNTAGQSVSGMMGYYNAINTAGAGATFSGVYNASNNDLIIHPPQQTEASAIATFKAVYNMITNGADSGAYDGFDTTKFPFPGSAAGISSASINIDANAPNGKGGLALGVLLNDDGSAGNVDGSGNPLWGGANSALGSWDGATNLSQYDTLVKYTFVGDLFLEGAVSTTDAQVLYANLGHSYGNTNPNDQSWESGDGFYQSLSGGFVNTTDNQVTYANLSRQSQYPYTATFAQPSSSLGSSAVSVPEPASIVTALLGIFGIAACVRRLRSAK
jgi:hypothetical protein